MRATFNADQLEHLAERQEWCAVTTRPTGHGTWDVVLVIDGHYTDEDDAERLADYHASVLGVPRFEQHPDFIGSAVAA
jgi:hypothetical protein